MTDEPKDYVAETGKAEPRRGRSKPKRQKNPTPTDLGSNPSTRQSDTSSADSNLSKAVPDSSAPKASGGRESIGPYPAEPFGISDQSSILALLRQVFRITPKYGDENKSRSMDGALATLRGIAPRDAVEGLLAAQMIGVHNLAMECLARALVQGQASQGVDANVNR